MDRLNQLRGEPGGSRDSTLDTTSPPSEAFLSAHENSSKYFSLSDVDSTFDITPIKDVSLDSAADSTERAISDLSPVNKKNDLLDSYKIGKLSEAANILSGGVDIFDDNDNSYDGDELVIDDNVPIEPEEKANTEVKSKEAEAIPSKDTEVVLQIQGKSVEAIDIGNGLYLYRTEGEQEELAAVQVMDPEQHPPNYKFLKVRENNEGNLEVYEEIEVVVPKNAPSTEGKLQGKSHSHVPIKNINQVIGDSSSSKAAERTNLKPKETTPQNTSTETNKPLSNLPKEETDGFNGKMKFNETRKSPIISTYTPMAYHSTPSKEGIPLTKTMVEMQLHPSRHSDNTKKTIEVNTETCKKSVETPTKIDLPIEGVDANKIVKESPDTLLKDDKIPVEECSITHTVTAPKDKESVAMCKDVESDETELNKNLPKSQNVEKESENTSITSLMIDRSEALETDKVNSSEISSTTTGIVNVDEKSKKIENESKATADNKKTEIFEGKPEDKTETAIAETQVNISQSSGMEVTPPERKNTKLSLKCKPDENKGENLGQTMVIEKEGKNIEEERLEASICEKVSATHCEDQVMEDKKAAITETREEKITIEESNKISEAKPADIKDANLVTQNKKPSSALSSNLLQKELNMTEAAKVSVPSISILPLPNKDVKAFEPITQIVGEPKQSETTQNLVEPKQNMIPEIKSSFTSTDLPLADTLKTEVVKSSSTEKKLQEKDIKPDTELKAKYRESSKSDRNSSNDLIQLNDLDVDLTTQRTEREILEKSLEIDIGKLDQQLKTAQTKEEVVKPEINKLVTAKNAKSSETILSAKVKPHDLIVKAETKPIVATELNQNKPLDNSEFVNKQVNKALLIRSPTNATEPSKTSEPSKFTLESCNMAQRPDMAKKDIPKVAVQAESKPKSINNNAPCNVPFGKWTEANKQEYLNKIRETKVTTNTTTQLKQANDLNRRDVLKKIESQRQSNSIAAANAAKNHEIKLNHNKPCVKNETTVFNSKPTAIDAHAKNPLKTEVINKPDSMRLTIGPNLTITPVLRPVAPSIATSSLLALGKKEVSPSYVPKTEFAAPNTANIAKRETPLQYPFNMTKKDVSRNTNATKRETATTISANIITAPNVPLLAKKETVMPRATNLSKKDPISYSNTNIAKVETVTSNVAKKEIVTNRNTKIPTKDAVASDMSIPKKELPVSAQNSTKKETTYSSANVTKKETDKIDPKKDSTRPTNQDLIDKTIEDYLLMERRPMNMSREAKEAQKERSDKLTSSKQKDHSTKNKKVSPLDDIEMQMNELHGIPFIERPPHELPHRYSSEAKTYSKNESRPKVLPMSKVNKLPNLMPLSKTQDSKLKANDVEELSEEEIIEHEPITGDIEMIKKDSPKKLSVPQTALQSTSPKKDNVITENDFDKFVRRNSITYENCITVNYDVKKQHNVVQSVVGKDLPAIDVIPIMPQHQNKGISNSSRFVPIQPDDGYNANYHSKLQIAYQSALTAKQKNSPITVLEDKPVKVVFVDNNAEFVPSLLNVQGKELSPAKRGKEPEVMTLYSCDSMDSEVIDTAGGTKPLEGAKKHKHQRKQVLTPVEAPEPELIEPKDLSLEGSPKKKRKTEDPNKSFSDNNYSKSVSKKNYILARSTSTIDDKRYSLTESQRSNNITSAIDSLVKAAELLENQSEKSNQTLETTDSQTSQPTPVKRGRGRPRKNPLPDGTVEKSPKVQTPQKKPRVEKTYDTSSEGSSDDEMVRENWTMGKINEDIVCPICKKLFRSENVVFKHVKHCTGPSPNRSDSGKRSRDRISQESDSKYRDESLDSMDLDMESQTTNKTSVSKEDINDEIIKSLPVKSRRISEKRDHVPTKGNETRRSLQKAKATHKTNNLVCEFCGKTFRQLSYLVSHKMQHNNDECSSNKDASEKESASSNKPAPNVFSCEVCKKEFRKLHHLVQHRRIHNPANMPSTPRRKSSADISEKVASNSDSSKITDDQSAGFRCEPCDKSFRKLHHLVEHRETHDGINRQKNTGVAQNNEKEKVVPLPPQCDVCKKTFRKLHHLIEHKEQHVDINSEKSDDKSVKSALSTKDIIHECSLCYMVFPNEHSLTKHTVICQRKKRQSKQSKLETEDQTSQDSTESVEEKSPEDATSKVEEVAKAPEGLELEKSEKSETAQVVSPMKTDLEVTKAEVIEPENKEPVKEKKPDLIVKDVEVNPETPKAKEETTPKAKPEVAKPTESFTKPKPVVIDTIVIEDTPKKEKKPPQKAKIGSTVTKRQKTTNAPLPMLDENKPTSDEDEIRYMLNPNFKFDENAEEKNFMKVRGLKRNSLQIERPKSNLIKRRISLQHPPRVARLKPKVEPAVLPKKPKLEVAPSTDSDDSDVVKYSFPPPVNSTSESKPEPKVSEKKARRKSIAERRKSLGGIAKRKSVGKAVSKPMKVLQEKVAVKKRLPEAGHRCDCGQLFSSAALLSRHTTLAHTPPRIRRRRSPPPPIELKKPPTTHKPTKEPRKSSLKSEASASNTVSKATRKSSADPPSRKRRVSPEKTPRKETRVKESATKTSTVSKTTGVKLRRSAAHSGVPVPEKMRKLMEKLKK